MTALERAKRFVQKHAAETALVIVPLAMASSVEASSVNFIGTTASITDAQRLTLVSSGSGFDSLANGGVQFFGDYVFDVIPDSPSGGSFDLMLTIGGTASGVLDMDFIPGSWDYALNGLDMQTLSSDITFFIKTTTPATYGSGTGAVNAVLPNRTFSGAFGLSGWDPFVPESLASWSVELHAVGSYRGSGQLTLTIPNHSIDIAPLDDGTGGGGGDVPEPATLLLLGPGAAFLIRRHRARHQRH
jgi:hypothetical protein